jgi:ribonuclease Z
VVVTRQLIVLGTASQAPTRDRNHNGYLVRWDALGVLFDPGEGTQRQLLRAGQRSSMITHIALTHRHGDHVLGLPGILARMALDQRTDPVTLLHPQDATETVDHLLALTHGLPMPVHREVLPDLRSTVVRLDDTTALHAVPLDHRVPALGYRLQEDDGLRVDPDRLAELGLHGPAVGRLLRDGYAVIDDRRIDRDDVAVQRPGQSAAFVMDTRTCEGIDVLLRDADLAVVESTFQDGDEDLADRFAHLTASQAGEHAARAGVGTLVLAHYSQRYDDVGVFAAQAGRHHDRVVAAVDLDRIDVPDRVPAAG